MANTRIDRYMASIALAQSNIKVFVSGVYAFYRQTIRNDLLITEAPATTTDSYISGGFVESKVQHFTAEQHQPTEWTPNPMQLQYLNMIIVMLNEKSIDFILVRTPVAKRLYNSYTNNHQFDSLMAGSGKYYNFNQLMELSDTLHFTDSQHLNPRGVEAFNHPLLKSLQNHQ